MVWSRLKLSVECHSWMAHILFYGAWDFLGSSRKLSDDVTGFIRYSLLMDLPPSDATVADCLVMIGLFIGCSQEVRGSLMDPRFVKLIRLLQPSTRVPHLQDLRQAHHDYGLVSTDRGPARPHILRDDLDWAASSLGWFPEELRSVPRRYAYSRFVRLHNDVY